MAGFADVVLRGLALSGQAIAVGGVLFAFFVAPPAMPRSLLRRIWTLVAAGAIAVVLAQALALVVLSVALGTGAHGFLGTLVSTAFVLTSLVKVLGSAALAIGALVSRARAPRSPAWTMVLGASTIVIVSSAFTSHGIARLEHRVVLTVLDALHQGAAAAWIGGLVQLIAIRSAPLDFARRAAMFRRFSTFALIAVGVLVAAGVGLSVVYVDGPRALVGTAYGIMVLTKVLLLGGLLALGGLNFLAVRRLGAAPDRVPHLQRFVEVEVGLGISVLFAAASLTSLPPAVDVTADRATVSEVATRFTPQWPRLTSPGLHELPVDDPYAPRTDADRAWSEYNHHVSGMFVLLMGVLAVLHVTGRAAWARHWPLVLLGLAGFMLVRTDPGAWPLGRQGFWASMTEPSVLQHRIFVVLVVAFGLFEWAVRTGRVKEPRYALIFPLLCAVGGGLLLTHSHASLNLKTEFLTELTHAPLGVLGIVIGWARWLELRMAGPGDRVSGRVWASAMAVVGVLLLLYRES